MILLFFMKEIFFLTRSYNIAYKNNYIVLDKELGNIEGEKR